MKCHKVPKIVSLHLTAHENQVCPMCKLILACLIYIHLRMKIYSCIISCFGTCYGAFTTDLHPRYRENRSTVTVGKSDNVFLIVIPHRNHTCSKNNLMLKYQKNYSHQTRHVSKHNFFLVARFPR